MEGAACRNPARSCAANHPDGGAGAVAVGQAAAPDADPLSPPPLLPTNSGKRRALAEDESTPPGTLTVLAEDPHWGVRWDVALNPATPPGTLTVLAADTDPVVRLRVADEDQLGHVAGPFFDGVLVRARGCGARSEVMCASTIAR